MIVINVNIPLDMAMGFWAIGVIICTIFKQS